MDIPAFTRTDGATHPTVLLEMKADGLWSDGKTPDATLEITKDTTVSGLDDGRGVGMVTRSPSAPH